MSIQNFREQEVNHQNYFSFTCGGNLYEIPEETYAAIGLYMCPNRSQLQEEIAHENELIQELQGAVSTLTTNISKVEAAIQNNRAINQKNVNVLTEQQQRNSEALLSKDRLIQKQKEGTEKFQGVVNNFVETELRNAKALERKKKEQAALEDTLQEKKCQMDALEQKIHLSEEASVTHDATISRQEHAIRELEEKLKAMAAEQQKRVEQLHRNNNEKCKQYKAEKTYHMKSFIQSQKTVTELTKTLATKTHSNQPSSCTSDAEGI